MSTDAIVLLKQDHKEIQKLNGPGFRAAALRGPAWGGYGGMPVADTRH